jgi:hypothetical protein
MRALDRVPERRFQSCAQLAAVLDAAAEGRTPTGESPVGRFTMALRGEPLGPEAPARGLTVRANNQVVPLERHGGIAPVIPEDLAVRLAPPRPYSLLAVGSLSAALTCCFPFALVALVTGWRALTAPEAKQQQGLWMAKAGITLGTLGLIANGAALIFFRRWLLP